ncbi:MAG TPA: hypothetical protein VKG85_09750 [Actinomycetes bacterium]|nr:hypothetical protein [Actinomycetes bacterium]
MNWLVGAATVALLGAVVLLIGAVVVRALLRLRRMGAGWPREYDEPRYDPPEVISVPRRTRDRVGIQLAAAILWVWFCVAVIAGAGWLVDEALADADLTWPYRSAASFAGMTVATLVLLLVAVPRLDDSRGEVVRDGAVTLLWILPAAAGLAYLMRGDPAALFAAFVGLQLFAVTERIIVFAVDL